MDAIRARIRRGTIEARKESGRWMVAVPVVDQDVPSPDQGTTATIAALESDNAVLRADVAALRRENHDLRANKTRLEAHVDRLTERIPLALTDEQTGRRRGWRWPWRRS